MTRRTGRGDKFIPRDELLATLKDVRLKIISIEMRATIGGPLYKACERARVTVDDIVEIATGDREALWEHGGAAPISDKRT